MSTSTSSLEKKFWLKVKSADSATEIFIIDGQFNLRARGIGYLGTQLEPGIYKIKVRAGFQTWEKPVVLLNSDIAEEIPPFNFVSPAPLEDTSKTHEFHIGAAVHISQNINFSVGHGSSIFIMARDWTSDTPPSQIAPSYPNPGRGLSLRDLAGNTIADLTTQGDHNVGWEPWAGCNIGVNPGCYKLSLETPSGKRIEQIIVASDGWQTQVFLLQRDYGRVPDDKDSRRADLQGASILLAHLREGFNPKNGNLRLAELARLGLCNARRVLSEDVRKMLGEKFDNPMLGIFGAHLLLLDKELDLGLLNTVITNLRMLLGGNHPDVEALALQLDAPHSYIFDIPPMLRKSWTLIVNATVRKPELIPDDSLASRIATNLWDSDPWLIWVEQDEGAQGMESATSEIKAAKELSNIEACVQSQLKVVGRGRTRTRQRDRTDSPFAAITKMRSADVQQSSSPVLKSMAPPFTAQESTIDPPSPQPDEEDINRLVQSLSIPKTNLEKMIAKLKNSTDETNE